ncbi:MAG: hypothetical protein C4524_01630 [Candidatus Zixiibacteriota bacterium]|nr:MAG: hypothetical protein C4524_01630 [candidate division Zixibacteria bacterium]
MEDSAQTQEAIEQEIMAAAGVRKKLKIWMLIGILVPVLALEVFASRALVKSLFFAPPSPEKHEAAGGTEPGEFYAISDLVVNPAATGGRRHLLVSVSLEYHDPLLKEELEKRDPQIRDNLITLLAGQESAVLTDIRYREAIRQSLLKAVNYYVQGGEIEKLYFTKYVFQ